MSASGVRGMACILDENGRLSDLSAADLPPNEIQLPACGSAGVLQTFPRSLHWRLVVGTPALFHIIG